MTRPDAEVALAAAVAGARVVAEQYGGPLVAVNVAPHSGTAVVAAAVADPIAAADADTHAALLEPVRLSTYR